MQYTGKPKQRAAFDRNKTKRNYKYKNTEAERGQSRKRLKGNLNVRNRPLREKKERELCPLCTKKRPQTSIILVMLTSNTSLYFIIIINNTVSHEETQRQY